MSKSQKRHSNYSDGDYSEHKIKAIKKKEAQRKLSDMSEDYLDDEEALQYLNDPKFYKAIKEYR